MACPTVSRKHVPEDMTVGFIGAGRMAQAMVKGFISTGILKASNIVASDPDPRCLEFIQSMGIKVTDDNLKVVADSQLVVLAVKPHIITPVLKQVSSSFSRDKLMVSIAAGITLSTLEENLLPASRVVRVMPNTPALVQAGASVLAPGSAVLSGDPELVSELLSCIGICESSTEGLLDAVTGLSGSGPAYAFVAIEALADGGVKMGLPRDMALKLAAQTLLGAAKMVLETGKNPGQLKDEVCSPGGTTIAAMHKLEKGCFRGTLMDAVEAATLKAKELGAKK
ncbi:pyrroline-5-carboxylate reductase 2-like [Mizuhopecten yessoensis]|uniref:pyrroline-5-carboxylate reductase n=1 Tax=Mizuhopecten yessoensis TaxID=6573 RepID=A0A210PEN4_MIZYE|nr:pyrroline-5-carboxylate reductase 2-like [Mizuhopecten yessoensis]OWF34952.1 Pyrroline-5-carboxylate reductase 2 [Mizuhopecten yessoensis]